MSEPIDTETPKPHSDIILTIRFNGKEVNVSGPLNDKVLCYGMLHNAMDAVRDFNKAQEIKDALEKKNGLLGVPPLSIA